MARLESTAPFSSTSQAPPVGRPAEETEAEPGQWTTIAIRVLTALVVLLVVLIGLVLFARSGDVEGWQASEERLQQLVEQLVESDDAAVRQRAARSIVQLGPDAVLAALEAVTEGPDGTGPDSLSLPPLAALAAVGPEVVDGVVPALAARSPRVRLAAACVLRQMGRGAEPAVPALAEALADENRWVRWTAAEALGRVGDAAAPAVEALANLAGHWDYRSRLRAVEALGQIGPGARKASQVLAELCDRDPQSKVRRAAARALARIGASRSGESDGGDEEVQRLIAALDGDDPYGRVAAAERLGQLAPPSREATAALIRALDAEQKWLVVAAAEALGAIGPAAAPALDALKRLDDPRYDPEVRAAARTAIRRIETPSAQPDVVSQ